MGRQGITLIETVIVLAITALIIVPLSAIISQVLLLPGERSDSISLSHSVRQATRWISIDARQASSFVTGANPDYGTFSWTERTGVSVSSYAVRYYYVASTRSIMREEDTGSGPVSAVIATNIADHSDISISASGTVVTASVTATAESTSGTITRSSSIKASMRPTARPVATTPPPVTLAWDDFENGDWDGGWGWTAAWSITAASSVTSSDNPYQGSYHALLLGSSGHIDRSIDLSGLTKIRLQFWAKAFDFEAGETATVSVSPDGIAWTVVRTWVDGQDDNIYRFEDIDLSGFSMSSEFWIAFDAGMSNASDYFYVDQVKVVQEW